MMESIFKKSNWMALITAGILFSLLVASTVFADYSGHVASFKIEKNAIMFVHKMKTKGLIAYYQKEDVPGKGEFYRSYIGGYKSLPLAQKALAKLKKDGEIVFFKIQETAEKNVEIVEKKTEPLAQTNNSDQKPENKTEITAQKNESSLESENKTEVTSQKSKTVQKPESETLSSINTPSYYAGIKGVVLKNGKVIKGQIISIDDNDVLKIRTEKGKILSYSFTKDVKKYITE